MPSKRSAGDLAASLGAADVLVLRRVRAHEWLHTGGVGRPAGWAGSVSDDPATEAHLARVLAGHSVVRVLGTTSVPVIGTYGATTAILVRTAPDVVVVLGSTQRSDALLGASDAELARAARELAELAESEVDDSAAPLPAVELREELAVLQAVHALTASLDQPVPVVLERLASVLAGVLEASWVLVWFGGQADHAVLVRDGAAAGGPSSSQPGDLDTAALDTSVHGPDPHGPDLRGDDEQDTRAMVAQWSSHLPGPGDVPRTGEVSPVRAPGDQRPIVAGPWLAVALDVAAGGGIVALREHGRPFGQRVQRASGELAATASTLLQVALARAEVERQLSDTRLQLGRDALTSASSRHHWDAELEAAQELLDSGVPVCVALLDLDDLKWVNDTHGHPAGDELLRTCADAVRGCLRGGSDVVARVGGDEFAVLVPRATDPASLTDRLRRGVENARTSIGVPLRVSVGGALCEPGQRVADAFAAADRAMYEDKRERRAMRGQRAPV